MPLQTIVPAHVAEGVADKVPEVVGQDDMAVPGIDVINANLDIRTARYCQPAVEQLIDDLLVQTGRKQKWFGNRVTGYDWQDSRPSNHTSFTHSHRRRTNQDASIIAAQ